MNEVSTDTGDIAQFKRIDPAGPAYLPAADRQQDRLRPAAARPDRSGVLPAVPVLVEQGCDPWCRQQRRLPGRRRQLAPAAADGTPTWTSSTRTSSSRTRPPRRRRWRHRRPVRPAGAHPGPRRHHDRDRVRRHHRRPDLRRVNRYLHLHGRRLADPEGSPAGTINLTTGEITLTAGTADPGANTSLSQLRVQHGVQPGPPEINLVVESRRSPPRPASSRPSGATRPSRTSAASTTSTPRPN
jgi:hypothetical protein